MILNIAWAYESPTEEKDFKRILKQNKNVLVLCSPNGSRSLFFGLNEDRCIVVEQSAKPILQLFKQVEPEIKGRGLLVHVNCEYVYSTDQISFDVLSSKINLEKGKNCARSTNWTRRMLNYVTFSTYFILNEQGEPILEVSMMSHSSGRTDSRMTQIC